MTKPDESPTLPSFSGIRDILLKIFPPIADVRQPPHLSPDTDVTGQPKPPPVEPVEEGTTPYNPYRGTEFHGVPSEHPFREDAEGYTDGTIPLRYDDSPPDSGPVIPVRVISDAKEQISIWRVNQRFATVSPGPAAQVANRNRARTKLTVENISATYGCWIGPDTTVSAVTGYYLGPGAKQDFTTTEEVYAVSADTSNVCPLSILQELKQDI